MQKNAQKHKTGINKFQQIGVKTLNNCQIAWEIEL
jgi:hypothetical protein